MGTRAQSEKWRYNEDWLVFWTTIGLDDPFHDVRTIGNFLLHKETEEISATEFAESPGYEAKGKKFFEGEKRKKLIKKNSTWFNRYYYHGLIIALIAIYTTFWGWVFSDYWGVREESSGKLVAEKVCPSQSLPMIKTEAVVENGLVKIPLDLRIR